MNLEDDLQFEDELFIGLHGIPMIKLKNDTFSGSACLRMMLNHLELYPGVGVKSISKVLGESSQKILSFEEMSHAIKAFGTVADLVQSFSSEDIRQEIYNKNMVLIKPQIPGGTLTKRWVIIHGFKGNEFFGTCSINEQIKWSDRLMDRIVQGNGAYLAAPIYRHEHPLAIAREEKNRIDAWKPIYRLTLREFVGDWPVILDSKLSKYHVEAIGTAADHIKQAYEAGVGEEIEWNDAPQWIFKSIGRNGYTDDMVITERSTNKLAGGISYGLRWTHPSFRGCGLGSEMILLACSTPKLCFLKPSSYSQAGYGSRVAAYRTAIERAREKGLDCAENTTPEYWQHNDALNLEKRSKDIKSTPDHPEEQMKLI